MFLDLCAMHLSQLLCHCSSAATDGNGYVFPKTSVYKNHQWADFDLWATVCQPGLDSCLPPNHEPHGTVLNGNLLKLNTIKNSVP